MYQWQLVLFCIMGWYRQVIGWAGSGLLLGLSFVTPFWAVGFLGAVWFLLMVVRTNSLKCALVGAWSSWTIKSLCTLWWIISVYPVDWLPVELGEAQLGIVVLCWLLSAAAVGFGGIAFVCLFRVTRRVGSSQVWYAAALATSWLAAEVAGSVMYAVLSLGPGGGLNISFSFGYLGYLLAEHSLFLSVATVAGVYSLGVVAVLLVGLLYGLFTRPQLRWYAALLLVTLQWSSVMDGVGEPAVSTQTGYRIAVIETDFASSLYRTAEGRRQVDASLEEAVLTVLGQGYEYVLLPEGAEYFNYEGNRQQDLAVFRFLHSAPQEILIDSGRATEGGKTVLEAVLYDGSRNTVTIGHKGYLVPQGEYLSYAFVGLARLFGFGADIAQLHNQLSYRAGSQTAQAEWDGALPGVLFCLESVSPFGVAQLVSDRADIPFVAHPISHGWFHEPRTLWRQQVAMLRTQAVWSGVFVVSAANRATSQVYTPTGEVYVAPVVAAGEDWRVRRVVIPR